MSFSWAPVEKPGVSAGTTIAPMPLAPGWSDIRQ